jgi:ubiquitin-protein ligase E3 D
MVSQTVSVLPSISQVENSCLITLNTLLSNSLPHSQWQPVVPPRRHSMPNPPPTTAHASTSQGMVNADTSSALQTVLHNLRPLAGEEQGMVQLNPILGDNRNALMNELQTRVHAIATTLDESDAHLVISLVSLLSHAGRLAQLQQPGLLSQPDEGQYDAAGWQEPHQSSIFDTLDRQVSHLKARRADEEGDLNDGEGPIAARRKVERTLLWDRIDEDLEEVSRLCRLRMMAIDPFSDVAAEAHHAMSPSLPPEYDPADFEPPEYRMSYDYPRHLAGEKEKERHKLSMEKGDHPPLSATSTTHDEKMRLDFEAVTMAIDRLYLVAPQLHNQRVELKKKKVEEMKRASQAIDASTSQKIRNGLNSGERSRSGSSAEIGGEGLERKRTQTKGKGKQAAHDDLSELDSMLSLIGKASSRRMNDQAVVMSDEMKYRLQIARLQDDENVSFSSRREAI